MPEEKSKVGAKRYGTLVLVIVLGVIFALAVMVRILVPAFESSGGTFTGPGAGANDNNGFDLSFTLIPVEEIIAGGVMKDGIPAISLPEYVSGVEVEGINSKQMRIEHGKFLVSNDRVIGISLNGEARAYPIRVLNWHEVVNDEVGGVPIAVTYCPLVDSVLVFDRRLGGETLEFGVSGLLYNSNLLMYDRRGNSSDESLWSQLQGRAVSGSAARAGKVLSNIPAHLMRFEDWLKMHPETGVITGISSRKGMYRSNPYGAYFENDELYFPVNPLPPEGDLNLKERVLIVAAGGESTLFTLSNIAEMVNPAGGWRTTLGDVELEFTYRPKTEASDPETVIISSDPPDGLTSTVYSFWFGWYATHPDGGV